MAAAMQVAWGPWGSGPGSPEALQAPPKPFLHLQPNQPISAPKNHQPKSYCGSLLRESPASAHFAIAFRPNLSWQWPPAPGHLPPDRGCDGALTLRREDENTGFHGSKARFKSSQTNLPPRIRAQVVEVRSGCSNPPGDSRCARLNVQALTFPFVPPPQPL